MIELKNISKSFNGTQVLHSISTNFESGKINLIIGASGGGKSVLMRSMVGLIVPEEGEILFNGRDMLIAGSKETRTIRRELGMLFQGNALFDSLTVEENVGFPLKMLSNFSASEIKERVNFCLGKVNLEGSNNKFPSEISGGMKKRVGIARAIALEIKYLFCDEPNSGLDPITSRVIDELLLELTEEYEMTTVINSHDMKTVFDIGEHILFMYQGRNWWEGSKDELLSAQENNPELKAFITASYFN